MPKIIIAIIIIIIVTGFGYWIYQSSLVPEEGISFGVIEGSLSYPSEFIPSDMKVCAENIETKQLYCTEEHIKDEQYVHGEGYKIEAPIGDYYVYAITQMLENYKAYYSELIVCGFGPNCPSHEPVVVTIEADTTTTNIDPQDWYNRGLGKEQTCINSGGQVSESLCCKSTNDFPNLCLIGPCGCSPDNSHQVKICDCGNDKCFNGNECMSQ